MMEVARNSIRYVNMVVQRTGYIIGVGTWVQNEELGSVFQCQQHSYHTATNIILRRVLTFTSIHTNSYIINLINRNAWWPAKWPYHELWIFRVYKLAFSYFLLAFFIRKYSSITTIFSLTISTVAASLWQNIKRILILYINFFIIITYYKTMLFRTCSWCMYSRVFGVSSLTRSATLKMNYS